MIVKLTEADASQLPWKELGMVLPLVFRAPQKVLNTPLPRSDRKPCLFMTCLRSLIRVSGGFWLRPPEMRRNEVARQVQFVLLGCQIKSPQVLKNFGFANAVGGG